MARPREFDIDQALEDAMHAFWRHGYEATSMADLMDAMGLAKGSIYKAFGDKHQLFMAALSRYLDQGFEGMKQTLAAQPSTREALRAWLLSSDRTCRQLGEPRGCFAVNTVVERGPHDPAVKARLDVHFARGRQLLVDLVQAGQQAGELRTDWSAERIVAFLTTFQAGLATSLKGMSSFAERQQAVDLALDALAA